MVKILRDVTFIVLGLVSYYMTPPAGLGFSVRFVSLSQSCTFFFDV